MSAEYRKKNISPTVMGKREFDALLFRLSNQPHTPQSRRRVARIWQVLGLVRRLGEPLPNREKTMIALELDRSLQASRWLRRVSMTKEGVRTFFVPNRNNPSPDDAWEHEAVNDLVELLNYPDVLARIRECPCGKLFFRVGRKKFHHPNCKQNHYDSDPERREEHREKMRKVYWDEKERAKNPKNAIGTRTKR
jgi:hypothetical protein